MKQEIAIDKILSIASKVCLSLLFLWSARSLWKGLTIIAYTSGTVTGSEFGMLITLVNMAGYVLVWLSLCGSALGLHLLANHSIKDAATANH